MPFTPVPTPTTTRRPTQEELNGLGPLFPNIGDFQVIIHESRFPYNCFGWSLGYDDRFLMFPNKLELIKYYKLHWLEPCTTAEAEVDVYEGPGRPEPLHANRVDRKHADHRRSICSSKLGRLMLVAHHRRGLEQSHFGVIYGHFKMHEWHPSKPGRPASALPFFPVPDVNPRPTWNLTANGSSNSATQQRPTTPRGSLGGTGAGTGAANAARKTTDKYSAATPHVTPSTSRTATSTPTTQIHKIPRKNMNPYDKIPPADPRAVRSVQQLCSKIRTLYPNYVAGFEQRYKAWQSTWYSGANQFSSSPDLTSSPKFQDLAKLGPKIIPLVVEKLAQPNDFFATSLYNKIEKDSKFKVDPNNVLDYCTLQRHANLLVDMSYDRYNNIEEALQQFKASMQQKYYNLDTNIANCADDDAYKRLTESGEGAIVHIMMEWKTNSEEQANRIWEILINDIVHGRRPGDLGSELGRWEDWNDWFENKDYDDAP